MQRAIIHQEHILGTGGIIYMVTGRIPGDDDDAAALVAAPDEVTAQELFRAESLAETGLSKSEIRGLQAQYGDTFFVTGCYAVGEVETC